MSTVVQGAITTYASRIKTGNTPLIVPSPAVIARNRSIITGTPLAPAPALQARQSFRSNSRMNEDDEDEDEEDEFLDVESDEGKKDKEEEELEESGGFVLGPPADSLIQRRYAIPTKHIYRYIIPSIFWCAKYRTELQMENAALAEEVMIPIRLDIDLESFKIKDAFMWNMNGTLIS